MSARPQPPQHPPPVQRLWVRYARRGRMRFTSHRDFGRAFERALRRAGVPMAYSSGYSPHPRISYAGAAPTGTASEAEYLEIAVAERCDPEAVQHALNAALPEGFAVEAVAEARGSLADRLSGSVWRIDLGPVSRDVAAAAVERLATSTSVVVPRMTKHGLRDVDARAAVIRVHLGEEAVEVILRHQVPLVRPDDVLAALTRLTPALAAAPGTATRIRQGALVVDPAQVVPPF